MMDPSSVSVCRLHPGVAVTGFCPACLRDRLAGLHPAPAPSAADLRRCKSFSYARSAAAVEPGRRSCDLFRHGHGHGQQPEVEEADHHHHHHQQQESQSQPKRPSPSSSSLGGLLGKKLQQWRRKNKTTKEEAVSFPSMPPPPPPLLPETMDLPAWHLRRTSCDVDPGRATMLSLPVEEDDDSNININISSMAPPAVPRSDGHIPVEEDYHYHHHYYGYGYDDDNAAAGVPGGSLQTRDYYLDSSSRRRRSVDGRSTAAASARNSFSDSSSRMMMMMNAANNGDARVSPAGMAAAAAPAERLYHYHEAHHHHHHQSVLVHHQYCREDDELQPSNVRAADEFSGSFGSAAFPFRDGAGNGVPGSKPNKKGIKGWSIWGLISKKSSSSSRKYSAEPATGVGAAGGGGDQYPPWPELRARGYNGQMLRCNSSISARNSFSGTAGSGSGSLSGRRSVSGVDMRDAAKYNNGGGGFRTRRDEALLERNLSTRSSSYSRSGHHDLDPAMAAMAPPLPPQMGMQYQYQQQQFSGRPPNIPRRSSSKHEFSSLPGKANKNRRSTLGL